MSSKLFDPAPAARLLADAWQAGRQMNDLPPHVRPSTLAEGYAVQDRVMDLMDSPLAGWKLGVGSAANLKAANLDRPLVGRVLDAKQYRSGDTISLTAAGPVTVEFEVAFVLGRDIAPDELLPEPMDAVSEVRTTFELVLSRFVNRRAVGWPSFAADNVGFAALVIGESFDRSRIPDIAPGIIITANGQEVARGLTGDELTYPVHAFSYLLDHARERGESLKRGDICTLGTLARPFDLSVSANVTAKYPGSELRFRMEKF